MRYFAQLDASGLCVAIVQAEQVAGELRPGPRLIEVQAFDPSLLGRVRTGDAWSAAPASVVALTRRQFWKRWTRNERENFEDVRANGTPNQRRRLSAFAENAADGEVNLAETYWANQLNWMEANGSNVLGAGVSILAVGRAAQILAG